MMRPVMFSPSRPCAQFAAWGLALALAGAASAYADINVVFTGNRSFDQAKLKAPIAAELKEISTDGLTPARADDAAYYVAAFYRKSGYSEVSVTYSIAGGTLTLKIHEGPRTLLHQITFTGNEHATREELLQYMVGADEKQLAKDPNQFPYTTSEVQAGVDRIRGLYLSEGYLNVAIDASKVRLSGNGARADVDVHIVEGVHFTYNFDSIDFEGNTLFPRSDLVKALGNALVEEQKLPTVTTLHKQKNLPNPNTLDRSFSPGIENTMQRNLVSFYKSKGYFQAEVSVKADPKLAKHGKVRISFTIKPGALFHFDGVTVKDETKKKPRLNPNFLPKRFAPLNGQVYDPAKLDETFREMLRTGLFENLRVTPTPIAGDQIRLDLTESEAKSKELGFTVGYGSYEGATVGLRAADRDIFGFGRPLTFSADYSQRGFRGELLYVDPWFLDSKYAMRDRIYSQIRDEVGYSHNDEGARIDFTRKVMPHLELGVFVEGEHTNVGSPSTGTTIDPSLLGPTNYTVLSVGLTQTTDYRNDPINPGRGFILTSAFDFGTINGEPGYLRGSARFSYYLPVGKCLLAFGARGGYIDSLHGELPIDLRFFNGGGTTVRSFGERELGPRDNHGNPLGGDLFTVFNVEFTFPISGGLQGAAFVDAGSLRNPSIPGESDLRYAVGLGLRYKLPIGPLRLDYGVNPDRHPGESFGAFYFSFGFAF